MSSVVMEREQEIILEVSRFVDLHPEHKFDEVYAYLASFNEWRQELKLLSDSLPRNHGDAYNGDYHDINDDDSSVQVLTPETGDSNISADSMHPGAAGGSTDDDSDVVRIDMPAEFEFPLFLNAPENPPEAEVDVQLQNEEANQELAVQQTNLGATQAVLNIPVPVPAVSPDTVFLGVHTTQPVTTFQTTSNGSISDPAIPQPLVQDMSTLPGPSWAGPMPGFFAPYPAPPTVHMNIQPHPVHGDPSQPPAIPQGNNLQTPIFPATEFDPSAFPRPGGIIRFTYPNGYPVPSFVPYAATPHPIHMANAHVRRNFNAFDFEPGPSGWQKNDLEKKVRKRNVAEIGQSLLTLSYISTSDLEYLTDEERVALSTVCRVLPTADPSFVYRLIVDDSLSNSEDLLERLFSNGYRTLKERKTEERKERRRQIYFDPTFDPEQYFLSVPDPEAYFTAKTRDISTNYTDHAVAFLSQTFSNIRMDVLKKLLSCNGGILLLAYRTLQNKLTDRARDLRRISRKKPRGGKDGIAYPDEFNEDFFREVQYCLNEGRFTEWKQAQDRYRAEKFRLAEECGDLKECYICCTDKLIEDDMIICSKEEHEFCKECIKAHSAAQLGEGATSIKCMSDACKDGFFKLTSLQRVLEPKLFQQLSRRNQQAEIIAANLDSVEGCPFCDYLTIIENPDDTVFKCLNPDCQKDSCRLCHEEEHLPLRCDEVEKDFETERRKYIEECMAEAVIRKCPKCKKSITKESGCNKMTCPCGCYFCYMCNAQLGHSDPYSHFMTSGCSQETSLESLHSEAARKAGKKALKKFNSENQAISKNYDKVPDIDKLAGEGEAKKRKRRN